MLDINDNAPYFTSRKTIIQINQLHRPAFIYQATAQDIDLGNNALISFELLNNVYGCFCINNKTGQVFMTSTLNQGISYRLRIRALDHGIPQLSSTLDVVIKQIPGHFGVFQTFLRLDDEIEVPFYRMSHQDIDSRSLFVLLNHNREFGMYTNGWLYLKDNTVRSRQISTYRLLCQVTDQSNNNAVNVSLIVYVERKPTAVLTSVFINSTYIFTATEYQNSSYIGTISIQNTLSSNAVLYIEDTNPWIYLDDKQTIRSRQPLDCHKLKTNNGHCQILLQVHGATVDMNSTCVVVIKIDTNNHGPTFRNKYVSIDVHRKSPLFPNYFVKTVERNIRPNNEIRYKILNTDTSPVFRINPRNGEIGILPAAQLESNIYLLHILAYDPVKPTLNDTMELCINVKDPVCCDDVTKNNSSANVNKISISEDTSLGTIIYKFQNMNNVDCICSSMLFFSIQSHNSSLGTKFIIHPNTGEIQVTGTLDYETQIFYQLHIAVNRSEVLLQQFQLIIQLQNANDNAPTFTPPTANWVVKDTTSVDSIIQSCRANDLDDDVIVYTIRTSEHFKKFVSFSADNCSIRLIRDLRKFVFGNQVSLRIQATDGFHSNYLPITLLIQRWSAPVMVTPAAAIIPGTINVGQTLYQAKVQDVYKDGIQYTLDGKTSDICFVDLG